MPKVVWCAGVLVAMLAISSVAEKAPKMSKSQRAATETRAQVEDCLTPEAPAEDVAPYYDQLVAAGNHEAIRLCYQIALVAMNAKRPEEAARVLDACIGRIEAGGVNDKSARKAFSKFHAESEKNFHGEPYEQAMIYFLRALLFFDAGDYENARAMCRSGALRDRSSTAEKDQYMDDMAEMDYLEAICNAKLKDAKVEDNLKFAKDHARSPKAVAPIPPDFNAVIVFFSGNGPYKYATGSSHEFLRFSSGTGAAGPLKIKVSGKEAAAVDGPLDNETFQATTRGGRVIDAVLAGKAQFKRGANIAGDIAIAGGAITAMAGRDDKTRGIGAALAITGLVAKGIAKATKPEADLRMCLPMPDDIYIFPVRLNDGPNKVRLECPETGVVYETEIKKADKTAVFRLWKSDFGQEVLKLRQSRVFKAADAGKEKWADEWRGDVTLGDGHKTPVSVFVKDRQEDAFTGYVKTDGGYSPCTGAIDKEGFRCSYREPGQMANPKYYTVLTGKNSGDASTGQVITVADGKVLPLGQYELSRQVNQKR